ncbi:MAG: beta-hexosaminidase [Clostridiales Family XIII bacterium]|nr:beta-hexosaminidase [Clostridiales Family XIII bacterium]
MKSVRVRIAMLAVVSVVLIVAVSLAIVAHAWREDAGKDPAADTATTDAAVSQGGEEPEPDAGPTDTELRDAQIRAYMDTLTTEQKVGQLFIVRCPTGSELYTVTTWQVGGFVLFGQDVTGETASSLSGKIALWQSAGKTPMIIATDEEGGTVNRVSLNTNLRAQPFPAPQDLLAAGGWESVQADAQEKAQLLLSLGINTNLAPVADVSQDPSSFIYDRTIGLDADGTGEYVRTVVTAFKDARLGSCLKHFPGYGDNADSHTQIVYDYREWWQVEADLASFSAGIDAGANAVLVSHNIVTSLDADLPASLSPAVHAILRNELGFDGVVMTDDMDMAGLTDFTSQQEAAYLAIKAGNDMVMTSHYDTQIPYLLGKIESGELTMEEVDAAVFRVLRMKVELGILTLE